MPDNAGPSVIRLDGPLTALVEAFNRAAGTVRVVALVSPT